MNTDALNAAAQKIVDDLKARKDNIASLENTLRNVEIIIATVTDMFPWQAYQMLVEQRLPDGLPKAN